ncbi:MAG: ceramidase [Methylobacterium sp.]|uniref:ceramidase domain-containing protein n=1 Tax=Methylobacterium sp. TaxID=409 RepID=UPI0025F2A7BE|nr:ceramidase domain-containing protein [Methylobacterium sp.]MBX9930393.1 ceramidase [Methylobacterium sp.]
MNEMWFAPIRTYCERGDASFWAEPLNAVSNGAFLIAAAALVWRERVSRGGDLAVLSLAILIALVGIGSFLFHTLAVRWSLLADVIPIALFIYAYFLLAMRRFLGLGFISAVGATLLFAAFNMGLEPALDALTGHSMEAATNGSLAYLPAVLALAGVAIGLVLKPAADGPERRAARALVLIAGLFAVSLTLRTLDVALCTVWPIGTHFLWHLLNAAVLFGLGATALRFRQTA